MRQGRVAQFINNTNFGEINNLLTQGREMDYIARHYHMDLALARPPRLSGSRWRAGPSASAEASRCRAGRLKAKPMAGRWRAGPGPA